ncbi:hypothetical protein L208DRAFT_612697 [Tricholoma matsutake]|nr:hypothetical protein L208DRAFT_612697 [Tricholoma matsutake 945]
MAPSASITRHGHGLVCPEAHVVSSPVRSILDSQPPSVLKDHADGTHLDSYPVDNSVDEDEVYITAADATPSVTSATLSNLACPQHRSRWLEPVDSGLA